MFLCFKDKKMSLASLLNAPEALVSRVSEMVNEGYPLTEILKDWQVSNDLELLVHKKPTRHHLTKLMKLHNIQTPKATTAVTEFRLWVTEMALKAGYKLPIIAQGLSISKQYSYKLIEKIDQRDKALR